MAGFVGKHRGAHLTPLAVGAPASADAAGGAAAAVAIQAVAESVTATRFEGSRAESDECVLKKILDVLVACVACPAGPLLSDDGLISLFQACYQVGHYQTEKGKDTSGALSPPTSSRRRG